MESTQAIEKSLILPVSIAVSGKLWVHLVLPIFYEY